MSTRSLIASARSDVRAAAGDSSVRGADSADRSSSNLHARRRTVADSHRHREKRGGEGLRSLGAGLRSCVRTGVRARPARRDRRGGAHRRPHSRGRRRHRHFAAGLFAPQPHLRRRHLGGDARQGARARRRARAPACRGARGDGRRAARISRTTPSTWWSRNTSSPPFRTRKRRSTNSRACSSRAARSSS